MLFMVIERFKNADPKPIGDRFKAKGRMMSADIAYVASWVEPSGATCFQLMEAPERAALDPWISCWADLVDFEVLAVQTSADFWAAFNARPGSA